MNRANWLSLVSNGKYLLLLFFLSRLKVTLFHRNFILFSMTWVSNKQSSQVWKIVEHKIYIAANKFFSIGQNVFFVFLESICILHITIWTLFELLTITVKESYSRYRHSMTLESHLNVRPKNERNATTTTTTKISVKLKGTS